MKTDVVTLELATVLCIVLLPGAVSSCLDPPYFRCCVREHGYPTGGETARGWRMPTSQPQEVTVP